MAFRKITFAIVLAFFAIFNQYASAAFVNGVESFDGIVKDTGTWYEHMLNPGPSRVTQNDNITLAFSGSEYVTKTVTVGVGQIVSVELLSLLEDPTPWAGKYAYLYLTTNDKDYGEGNYYNSHFIYVDYSYSFDHYHFTGGDGGGSSSTGEHFGTDILPPTPGLPYRLQIERTSINSAYCSAYNSDGSLIGGVTRTFSGIPGDLYISIQTASGFSATFDNVRITPEPATLLLFGMGVPILLQLRKRH